jgi:SAM-dependent methyltransferase
LVIFFIIAGILLYLFLSHLLSYSLLKKRILTRQRWGINICCGRTDGGGVNADIVKHKDVSNFVLIKDVYNLPFRDHQFETVLSSHTIEHVDSPAKFYQELKRIGKRVSIVIPPLWDITAALNVFEHKFIFLTFKKEHTRLPLYIKLPLASFVHKNFGQRIKA